VACAAAAAPSNGDGANAASYVSYRDGLQVRVCVVGGGGVLAAAAAACWEHAFRRRRRFGGGGGVLGACVHQKVLRASAVQHTRQQLRRCVRPRKQSPPTKKASHKKKRRCATPARCRSPS
jgi:hypothetical protein